MPIVKNAIEKAKNNKKTRVYEKPTIEQINKQINEVEELNMKLCANINKYLEQADLQFQLQATEKISTGKLRISISKLKLSIDKLNNFKSR